MPKEKWYLSPYTYPSIIEPAVFAKAQKRLNQVTHADRRKTRDKHIYLLGGLLECRCCHDKERDGDTYANWHGDRKEIGKGSGNYSYYYRCKRKSSSNTDIRCNSIPLPAMELEQYVVDLVRHILRNPKAVYEYQKGLKSSEKMLGHLKKQRKHLKELMNYLPDREARWKELYADNKLTKKELDTHLDEIKAKRKDYLSQMESVEIDIAQKEAPKHYIKSLELFNEKYAGVLDDISRNRKEIYDVLHMLVDDIGINTRPATPEDKIPGKKKKEQQIPYILAITLKLPQEFLKDLLSDLESGEEFEVKKTTW